MVDLQRQKDVLFFIPVDKLIQIKLNIMHKPEEFEAEVEALRKC